MEQRYQAVLEVLAGATVTDVARRNGVSRSAVHEWLLKYAAHGLAGLVDKSSKPASCPHQMPPVVEARIVALRREHPGWGPRTIGHRLGKEGVRPVPGRTSIYRCLVRHGLITPHARRAPSSTFCATVLPGLMSRWPTVGARPPDAIPSDRRSLEFPQLAGVALYRRQEEVLAMSVVRSTSKPAKPPYKPHGGGNVESYRLAFDESVRTLELLDKRLERVQTAYIAVLAFLGSAAAFLGGSVLTTLERTTQVRWLSFAATALFALALSLAIWDLWPRRRPGGVDAALIVEAYIEADVPAPYELTLAKLATQNADAARSVRDVMRVVSIRFAAFLSMTTVSIVLWVITAWVGKRVPTSP